MKKKLLFVFPSYNIGGTTVSTRNLISLLDKDGYDCWAMPLNPHGTLANLYEGVNIQPTPFEIQALSIGSWKQEPSFFRKVVMGSYRFLRNHVSGFERHIVRTALDKVVKDNYYDVIVACQEGIASRMVSYASIKEKVAWVRCDYKRLVEEQKRSRDEFYDKFKAIVCVSGQTCDNFKHIYPELTDRIFCIPNPQDGNMIMRMAETQESEPRFVTGTKTIVSIGRLDKIKRFDQIAGIARQLLANGLNFNWYIIGEGEEYKHIADSIKKYDVGENVIMLGVKTNPYYYIKRADALVCLSRSEACPRVVNEAKILHTPTISTDFPTIYEFIENGKTGLITTLEEMPETIMELFENKNVYESIVNYISEFSFDNTNLLDNIKELLT